MLSRPVTLFWQRVNKFLRWTNLFMSSIWQGSFKYQFEIFGLTLLGIEPRNYYEATGAGNQWLHTTINIIKHIYQVCQIVKHQYTIHTLLNRLLSSILKSINYLISFFFDFVKAFLVYLSSVLFFSWQIFRNKLN